MANFNFTLSDIKKELGDSFGLRSNRYLIIIPVPGTQSKKIAVLARSTSLPERDLGVIEVFDKGRKLKIRGYADLQGSYTINIIDDSEMKIRKVFDEWMTSIDDTKNPDIDFNSTGILGKIGTQNNKVGDWIKFGAGAIRAINEIKTMFEYDYGLTAVKNALFGTAGGPTYQTDFEVWQLGPSGEKVYGYKLLNCFVKNIGAVEISDDEQDTLSQFSVELVYSDLEPVFEKSAQVNDFIKLLVGQDGQLLRRGSENLFS